MSNLTHTSLTNIELCYDGVHTPLTRTSIANLPKDENGFWIYIVTDSFGNELSYEDSKGYWYKFTRDSEGNELSYESSGGLCYKYTRDSEGNMLSVEDKDGVITYLAGDRSYGLYYQDGLYKAGCYDFTYDEAIAHWTERAKQDKLNIKSRAIKFLAAIETHHKSK